MPAPNTKEEALQQMRLIWLAFLVSVLFYVYIGYTMPPFPWLQFRHAQTTISVLGVLDLLNFVWFRVKRFPSALQFAQARPQNIHAIRRWRIEWIILVTFAEAEAMFGILIQWGQNSQKAIPFYALSFLLILSLWPRQIAASGDRTSGYTA
jgi:hypothetical protein